MERVQDVLNLPADILKVFQLFTDSFMALPIEIRFIMTLCLTVVCLFGMVRILA